MRLTWCLSPCSILWAAAWLVPAGALAFPSDAADLHRLVTTRHGGDANAWVEASPGDFERIACRNRRDLLQQLLDDGLAVTRISTRRLLPFYACALKNGHAEVFSLIAEPESLARIEQAADQWGLPLHYAIGSDNHANVLTLLRTGAGLWDKRKLALENYTRDGHLLNAAVVAVEKNKTAALRAMEEAGFASIVQDARNREFALLVGQLALERNRGDGGRFLLAGLADLAIGAALGGSPADFVIASTGTALLQRGEANEPAAAGPVDRGELQRRLARYLRSIDPPAAPEAPAAATPPSGGTRDLIAELERLADLRDRGVLSEEEFNRLKARVLAEP